MPQFDFNTYPSQIFWFGLCFIVLYLFAHLTILPRIKSILSKRHDLISNEKDLTQELSKQINMINNEAEQNFRKANENYLLQIDEIIKKTNLEKDNTIENLKKEIENKINISRSEIKQFVADSRSKNFAVIQNLFNVIKNKIIN